MSSSLWFLNSTVIGHSLSRIARPKQICRACSRCNQRARDPEAEIVDPLPGGARVAERGTDFGRREVPGTAAVDMVRAVAACDPGRTVRRRAFVVAMDAVLAICVVLADVIAPRIGCLSAGPRRIFVFGFREQPIGLARHFGQPCRV